MASLQGRQRVHPSSIVRERNQMVCGAGPQVAIAGLALHGVGRDQMAVVSNGALRAVLNCFLVV